MKEISLNQWCTMLPNETKVHVMGEYIEDGKLTIAKEFHLVGLNTDYIEYHEIGRTVTEYASFVDVKPILFDLSWITKEIEIGGEKFVPIHRLLEASNFNISQMDEDYINSFAESMVEVAPTYDDVQLLLSWKFNVFNLPDELIVKVSENFNPYK